uniref:Uncharacterized protein n=1 Tax=Pavo cristatus TaxID=9049 RepID=A0A8C9LF84_PAVCR
HVVLGPQAAVGGRLRGHSQAAQPSTLSSPPNPGHSTHPWAQHPTPGTAPNPGHSTHLAWGPSALPTPGSLGTSLPEPRVATPHTQHCCRLHAPAAGLYGSRLRSQHSGSQRGPYHCQSGGQWLSVQMETGDSAVPQ